MRTEYVGKILDIGIQFIKILMPIGEAHLLPAHLLRRNPYYCLLRPILLRAATHKIAGCDQYIAGSGQYIAGSDQYIAGSDPYYSREQPILLPAETLIGIYNIIVK